VPSLPPVILLLLTVLPLCSAEKFRVATYNLQNYLTTPVGTRPAKTDAAKAKIRESIRASGADVLALQEVGGTNALFELRSALRAEGSDFPFWELVNAWDTNIQVAVLSRWPIVARRPHTNDSFLSFGKRHYVKRGFAEVDIRVGSDYVFTLITAHLKSKLTLGDGDEQEMREEEATLLRAKVEASLSTRPNANLIVAGDLNDHFDSRPVRTVMGRRHALIDTRPAEANGDDQPNSNARYPAPRITWTHFYAKEDSYSRIDYILVSQGMSREWIPAETFVVRVPNWGVGSDHRPIVATFVAEGRAAK
jgi:endonuclease/exonuclease/phosphatase family metal-dependent hydrolase